MPRALLARLMDIQSAIRDALEFVAGRSLEEYEVTPLLRAAVEHKLTIIGGTLGQINHLYPNETRSLTAFTELVELRQHLVQQYFCVDSRRVWEAIPTLPRLQDELSKLARIAGSS